MEFDVKVRLLDGSDHEIWLTIDAIDKDDAYACAAEEGEVIEIEEV